MQSGVYEEIGFIAEKMKEIDGVIGLILLGSYARGDFEEGSDIDLLVIFRNREMLEDYLRDVYRVTSESSMFIQAICLTLTELMSSPLLHPTLREGKVYYAEEDAKRVLTPTHKPYALVTYTTANLSPKGRVVFAQRLEGRGGGKYRYEGLIQKLDGFRVGRGVLMVPLENLKTLVDYLEEEGVGYVIRYVWA